MAKKYLERN